MRRKVALSLVLTASAALTIPFALRASLLEGIEVLALHLFFLVDVAIRPAIEAIGRESAWRSWWGKLVMVSLVYAPIYFDGAPRAMTWMIPVGTAVTIFGAALALHARLRLGRMATPVLTNLADASLCQDGIYRSVRHPIYSGFSLAFLGHQIAFMFMPGLVVWTLFILTFLRPRINLEEQMLVEQFGARYLGYQRSTWKMFPCLY